MTTINKNFFFAPWSKGLGATRRAAVLLLAMMLTTMTVWAQTTSTITVGGTDYTLFTGFTATGGNGTNYAKLVDGNTSTDWIAMKSSHFNGDTDDPAFVEFHADAPIIPKGYVLTCDNDADLWKPVQWALKARLNEGDAWTTIHSSNTTLGAGKTFEIPCSNDGNNKYQYFRFEVYEVGATDIVDLDELQFYGFTELTYTHLTVKAPTCTEVGIRQECYRRSDGKYFSDENGTTELNESDVIEPMIPHTGVEHAATENTIHYWQCSMCNKYFSDEACTNEITEPQTHVVRYLATDGTLTTLDADATAVTSSSTSWNDGWYVVYDDVTIADRISVSGTVNLILFDGATLTANKGIGVGSSATFNVYAQSEDEATMGALVATAVDSYNAAIGGTGNGNSFGTIVINGGKITAANNFNCGAPIGGAYGSVGGNITINGGIVSATAAEYSFSAGIGGGNYGYVASITLNGGIITATGDTQYGGAGIGTGSYPVAGTMTITIGNGVKRIVATKGWSSECIGKESHGGGPTVNVVFKNGENDVTANKDNYFTIIENDPRLIIVQKADPTIADVPEQTYTGSEIKPEPQVTIGSLILTKGTDYTYSYTDHTNVGTAKVRATLQGDFESLGYVEKEFTITKATPNVTAPTAVADLVYNGSAQALVTGGTTNVGDILSYSLDGTNYSDAIPTGSNVGSYTVYYKVEGSANWNAVEGGNVVVAIAPKAVTNEDITVTIPSQTWTGNELTPVITVKDGENVLTENTDYTVTPPSGPIQDSGNHAYTITGMGNYADSREATFTITPFLADQFGAVYVYEDQNGKTALLDGTSVNPVDIDFNNNIIVNHVTSNRTFTPGMASTVMLPFNYTSNGEEGGTFYKFVGVEKENNVWVATMQETGNDANNEGTLEANTPYLFMPAATTMTFPNINGSVRLFTRGSGSGGNCETADPGSHWTFKGTYWFKEWNSSNYYDAEEIGRAYGFAGVAKDGINVGDFVRVASGAKIRPMRAYLLWNDEPNAANARSFTRGAAAKDEELPQSITVRLVGSNGETTGIGTLDTETGEMTFDSEAWYTLDGVRLSGKPTKKGLYINNGKKIVIK